MYFYPNECYVCEATDSLKQCGSCKMVSYCGEPHQKVDWKNHKTFCRAISTLLKKNHQSHLFEGLKGLSRHKWMDESKNMWPEIILLLNRSFFPNEEEMLQFPRVCFICFEARQNLLKNCPNCPFASFCKEHPTSPIHDKNCHEIKMVHDKKVLVVPSEERIQLNILVASLKKSDKPPLSMEDLMEQQFGKQTEIEENVKYYVSEAMSVPLTLYNAFQKLNQPLQSEIVVHVQGVANVHVFVQSWESILHLMPHIISLTIVFIDSKQNSCTNVTLCNKCVMGKKKLIVEVPTLPYVKYVKKKSCRKPNLLAMFMMDLYYCTRDQFRMWHENLDYWNTSSCPIVIAYKGNVERFVIENLHPYICNSSFYYMGLNSFSPLYPCLNPYDWTCCKNSMNLIIAKSPRESKTTTTTTGALMMDGTSLEKYQEEDDIDDPDNSIEWKKRLWRRSFYHSVCYVCQSMNPMLACKKCKMIFYCGENHQRVHWPYHKMICRAILGMLNETGATSVFDKLPIDNDALWLKGKFDLLKKTELKIGKELFDGEREMFLFPKTCFICHINDSSILKNCKCGISFCKIHMRNANHKENCKDFSLSRKLMLILEPRVMHLDVKVLSKKSNNFPEKIEDFIRNYLKFNNEDFGIPNIQNILLSDYLSRTLTFLYCAECLMDPCYFENDSLVIHVIGATMREKYEAVFWKFILYWFDHMKNLKIIFIGPEVETKIPPTQQTLLVRFDFSSIAYMRYQNLEIKSYTMKYEDYYRHQEFIVPDIVIGFNLNIHESDANTWDEAAKCLTDINCYFIMTAKSKARSFKDDNSMEAILDKIDYYTLNYGNGLNPYASLIPERDYETEGLCYSNKAITFCTMFEKRYRPSGKSLAELKIEMVASQKRLEAMLRDQKKAEIMPEDSPMKKNCEELNALVKCLNEEKLPQLEALFEMEEKIELVTEVEKKLSEIKLSIEKDDKNCDIENSIENNNISISSQLEENSDNEINDKNLEQELQAEILEIQRKFERKMPETQNEKFDRKIRKAMRRIGKLDLKDEQKENTLNGENFETNKIDDKDEENEEFEEKIDETENENGKLKYVNERTIEKENLENINEEKEETIKDDKERKIKIEDERKLNVEKLIEEKEEKEGKIKEETEEKKVKEEKIKGENEEKEGKIKVETEEKEETENEEEKLKDDKERKLKKYDADKRKLNVKEEIKESLIKEETEDADGKLKDDNERKIKKEEERKLNVEDKEGKIKEETKDDKEKLIKNMEEKEEKIKEEVEEEIETKEIPKGREDKEGKLKEVKDEVKIKVKEEKEGEKNENNTSVKEEEKNKEKMKAEPEKEETKQEKPQTENSSIVTTNSKYEKKLKIEAQNGIIVVEGIKIEKRPKQELEIKQKTENYSLVSSTLKNEDKPKVDEKLEVKEILEIEKKSEKKLQIVKKSEITNKLETNEKSKIEKNETTSVENIKINENKNKKKEEKQKGKSIKDEPNSSNQNVTNNLDNIENIKAKVTKKSPDEAKAEEKVETPKVKNDVTKSKKSKNKKQSKPETKENEVTNNENIETTIKQESNKPKSEPTPIESKKTKNKKQSKIDIKDKEIPIEIEKQENSKTPENNSQNINNKKSKNKKSKNNSKEIIDEEDASGVKEMPKIENAGGSKKSKNKKQLKTEKETITVESNDKLENKKEIDKKVENNTNDKNESKKSKKQQKIDAKKTLAENSEKISEKLKNENIKKSKQQKNHTKCENAMENAQQIENTLLRERNKLLEEHLFLMRENEKLKLENSRLREESERLKKEKNEIINNNDDDDDNVN
ncbi:centromere-associated protein E-like [Leptopilina boulardi]|uniref:centromere-associated protein E-like n=1 Tax=Leptopilina boulardi TaxID=63433 RepID=UPI0021F5610C|nr:centromere-associated protein E-like [Leptopilina boulardi]